MAATADGAIRVAMLHGPGEPDRDGVSDYVVRLLRALDSVGVAAYSVPLRPPERWWPTARPAGGGRWLAAAVGAARSVRNLRPDLVHVQFAPSAYRFSIAPGLLPVLLPRQTPLVTTLHEYGQWSGLGRLPQLVGRRMLDSSRWDQETGRLVPASDALIVTNREHADQVIRRTGRRPVEVPLAPNVDDCADAQEARMRWQRRLRLGPDGVLLVFFGFVHPVKGVRYLLEALAALRSTCGDVRLLVVGGFTSQALPEPEARAFRAELTEVSRQSGVAEAVTFTDHLPAPEVSAALHAADVVVLPFTAGVTTKSGALLAALAHGRPTAVTVTDPPDPALRPDETVAVIPTRRDPAAIAGTVARLLHDAGLRARLAAGARAFGERHSWTRVAAAHRSLYDSLLGAPNG